MLDKPLKSSFVPFCAVNDNASENTIWTRAPVMSVKNKTNDLCGQSILFKKNGLVGSNVVITGVVSMRV